MPPYQASPDWSSGADFHQGLTPRARSALPAAPSAPGPPAGVALSPQQLGQPGPTPVKGASQRPGRIPGAAACRCDGQSWVAVILLCLRSGEEVFS